MPTTTLYQRSAMAAAIAACFPGALHAAGVARVDFASGNVAATGTDGQTRSLSKGSEIQVGETVSTQSGRAQLRFADGAYMSLQPQTDFKVEEFKYSGKPGDASDNIVMNLLKGGMRTITGLIGRTNRNAYRLKTDVATIGIRGTEYTVKYTNSIELFVADGAVQVDNQSGSFTVPGGSGVMVSNQQTPPQQTDQKPVLPPESPTQQKQSQEQTQTTPPVNPIQEATPATPLLTGTITANIAVAHPYFSYGATDYVTATLSSAGVLTSFDGFEGGTTTIGTSAGSSSGNDGVIAWGRWSNGAMGGTSILSGQSTVSPSDLHYVVGIAPATMPGTGTATYSMIGATPASFEGGTMTVTSSMLKFDFSTFAGSFHGAFNVNGNVVTTSAPGVPLYISGTTIQQSGGGSLVGPFCFQNISLQGIFAGDQASRAGIAYLLSTSPGTGHGVIAYTKSGP